MTSISWKFLKIMFYQIKKIFYFSWFGVFLLSLSVEFYQVLFVYLLRWLSLNNQVISEPYISGINFIWSSYILFLKFISRFYLFICHLNFLFYFRLANYTICPCLVSSSLCFNMNWEIFPISVFWMSLCNTDSISFLHI
jgi:hypothetical protein